MTCVIAVPESILWKFELPSDVSGFCLQIILLFVCFIMCDTCDDRQCHVQISGASLVNLTREIVKQMLDECSLVKPEHVLKEVKNR